jgi:hypothetical protein
MESLHFCDDLIVSIAPGMLNQGTPCLKPGLSNSFMTNMQLAICHRNVVTGNATQAIYVKDFMRLSLTAPDSLTARADQPSTTFN